MKEYSAFPKTPASLEPHHHPGYDTHWGWFLPLCRGTVGVFYSSRRMDQKIMLGSDVKLTELFHFPWLALSSQDVPILMKSKQAILFIGVLWSLVIYFYILLRCNGFRRRKWTRRREFKSLTILIAFHVALIPLGKVWIQLFSPQLWLNSRTDWVLQPWWGN